MMPRWIDPRGLLIHAAVGAVLTVAFYLQGVGPVLVIEIVAAIFFAHEWADGDLRWDTGAPWNGLLDIAAALPVPLLYWVLR